MSLQTLNGTLQRLLAPVEALAALGAELRIRREGLAVDGNVGRGLRQVMRALDPDLLDGVTPDQEETALSTIRSAMRQALDLLENPARAPGWTYQDPEVLQGQGKASRRFIEMIETAASQRPDLQRLLQGPGTLLDVGTGVGWFAIEAVRTWPSIRCVGIDAWEPSLQLARANIAGSGTEDRIDLRVQDVMDLEDQNAHIVAWFAAPYIPTEIIPAALKSVRAALIPGGWLVFPTSRRSPDPLVEALVGLKAARCGAHLWTGAAAEQQLRSLGLERVETCPSDTGSSLVIGRKPTE